MIPAEKEAEILRLHHVERWPVGTIASQLGLHHSTVERVLRNAGIDLRQTLRPSIVDPYVPLIVATLEKYPKLTASRLHEMARERGFTGSPSQFRHIVARYRPRKPAEAFQRLRTLPGEQAQVDWAYFGKLKVGDAERRLVAFVMVLSWSRAIFLHFYLGEAMPNFLRGHVAAFEHFGGVPRVLLYDNLKSAVIERVGDAIRFNPTLLKLASHYRFEPRPVAPYRGNEKGRVERAIQYARESFFAGRTWRDVDDLNRQAIAWCTGIAADRRCPEDRTLSVRDAREHELAHLVALPDNPLPTEEVLPVSIGKTPYARFDGNDYSVPHTLVRRTLTVAATTDVVRILDGERIVATHPRSYERARQIEDPAHLQELAAKKSEARQHRAMDRLATAAPSTPALFLKMAERGHNLGAATNSLLRMLDRFGGAVLDRAIHEALSRDVPHLAAIHQILDRHQHEKGLKPPIPIPLPDDPKLKKLVVTPHRLDPYGELGKRKGAQP